VNIENNSSKTVTSLISRSIKPGYEKDYDDWLRRFLELERKALGYLGTTVVLPGGINSNIRYIIRRFTDKASMEIWDNSPDVQKLLQEVNRYSTRHYETTTGLETWFVLPDLKTIVPPPRWKMAIVVFIAAYTTSLLTRSFLAPLISEWPLIASTVIFTTILVISLTYFALPVLSRLLRRWLYSGN
jgi:antibiotic biosynthesis monooxygenase (ABM) superfamily enzyme